jgi:hypothetical protein
MKKSIILMAMLASSSWLCAQSIERFVIGSAGGSYNNGMNLQLDYTIGELAVTTISNGSNHLTQGFQQPFANSTVSIAENPEDPIQVEIYPNPITDEMNVMISNGNAADYHAMIFDILGQMVSEETSFVGFDGKTRIKFDVKNLATGTYFISVAHDHKIIMTRKVVKVNL